MVSNNIYNQKYNVPMQAMGYSSPTPATPPMGALDSQSVQQAVDNSYLSNRVKASSGEDENPFVKLGLTAGLWYVIMRGMEGFTRDCSKNIDDTQLGRLAAWGDKVQNGFTNSSIGKFITKGTTAIGNTWQKLAQKSSVLNALKNYSTRAEWNFARVTGEGLSGMFGMDVSGLFGDFMKPMRHAQQLEQYGYTQAQIDNFAQSLKGLSSKDRKIALIEKELEVLGADRAAIQNAANLGEKGYLDLGKLLKSKKLGFTDVKQFDDYSKNVIDNLDNILATIKKADPNLSISIWRGDGRAGKLKAHLFGRKVPIKELINKLAAARGQVGKTGFGKALTKGYGYLIEGMTNRFAGGKLGILMQAVIFADMLIHVFKAPKGEKVSTMAERTTNDFAYFLAGPLGYMAMHKVGGLKYSGTDMQAYRDALRSFNEKAKAGKFATKAEYNAAKKAVKDMLYANAKNPLAKIAVGIGRFINIGNESIAPYVSNAGAFKNLNFLRKIPNFMKNCVGVPLRLAIPFMIISPFVAKVFTKGAHAIFGRPTHSVLDEEETPQEQTADSQIQEQTAANSSDEPIVHNSPTNLLNMHQNGQTYSNTTTNTVINNAITNNQSTADGKVLEPARSYIPSPQGVVLQGEDMTAAQMAMSRADIAEKQAMEILSMKW